MAAVGGDTDRLEDVDMANGEGNDTDRLENVDVVRDVFYLVENQIPYFVIKRILSKTGGKDSAESNIAAYVRHLLEGHQYVAATGKDEALTESRRLLTESCHLLHLLHLHLKPTIDPVSATGGTSATGRLGHLLHLLHLHLKPIIDLVSATGSTSATDPSVGRWRTATEYDFAGIKLKKRVLSTEEARCILDVRLDRRGGTLHVPCLNIDRQTWRILRSLMALEQHNPVRVVGSHVTAYCIFMSQVACNRQDVALLSKEGIIVHQMGNHGEVADHFANLCKGVVFDANDPTYNYLMETCQAMEKRFRSRRGRWMAWLKRKYNNPWLLVGLVAAAIGLVCAIVQTVYSVKSYNKGTN